MDNIITNDSVIKPNQVVRQHNDLIGSVFKLTLTQLRMFYYCLAQIGIDETISIDKRFYIDVEGFAELYDIETHNARALITTGIETWADSWFKLTKLDPLTNEPILSRWITEKGAVVNDCGIINFAHNLIPLISELKLKGNFTRARIGQLAKLGTYYDFRFYNYAVEALKKPSYDPLRTRNFILTPNEIREKFEIKNKYSKTFDLKFYVLDPSIKNISEQTDIILKYVQVKKGRSIVGFDFHVIPKNEIGNPSVENPYSKVVLKVSEAVQLSKPDDKMFKELQELGYMIDLEDGNPPQNFFAQQDMFKND